MKKNILIYLLAAGFIALVSCCNSGDQASTDSANSDSTKVGEMKKISIKAFGNKYLCSDGTLGDTIFANRDEAKDWETFEVVKLESNFVNIKNYAGKFLCADGNAGLKLVANRDKAGDWETFVLNKQADGSYTIQNKAGKFLTADQNNNKIVVANRDQAGDWEKFFIEIK